MPEFDPAQQRAFAVQVVEKLRAAGFEAMWAGGCVRDSLLGRVPKDYDVGTTATPEQIREVFGQRRTLAIGAQFGVIAVLGPKPAGQVEVATFRRDATYSDGRRPDSVEFSTPEVDAQRRDFTINGLFYDPLADRVIDYVGGVDDLGRGIVRAIGEPRARFTEDKLRLLRAVRFTATFQFTLDMPTREAIDAMADQIGVVSVERIAAELRLMLTHRTRAHSATLLRDTGLLARIVPELPRADDANWVTTLNALDALAEPGFPLALGALLVGFVDAPTAVEIGRRWKLSNWEIDRVRWLLQHRNALEHAHTLRWSQLQPVLIAAGIHDLIALNEALASAHSRPAEELAYCREQLKRPAAELDPPPLVTGDDLIALRIPRGKRYQTLLQAVRDAQLDGQIATKAEALALIERLQGGDSGTTD